MLHVRSASYRTVIDLTGEEEIEYIEILDEDEPAVPRVFADQEVLLQGGAREFRARGRAVRYPAAAVEQLAANRVEQQIIDLTMENEDEPYPAQEWLAIAQQKHAAFGPEDGRRQVVFGLHMGNAPAPIQAPADATFQFMQTLAIGERRTVYAFVDNIEVKHLDNGSAVLVYTLDCVDAQMFWSVLRVHFGLFDVLYGRTLSDALILRRKQLLAQLLLDPTHGWVLRVIIGAAHAEHEAVSQFLRPLTWQKIFMQFPRQGAVGPLWQAIADADENTFLSLFSRDLYVDDGQITPFYTGNIQPAEVAYLEEIWSLNHIPDAPLPPASGGVVPGPVDPIFGFDILGQNDAYWQARTTYRTEIPAHQVAYTQERIARVGTGGGVLPFDIVYVRKGLYLLRRPDSAHSLLFLPDGRIKVGRVLRLNDVFVWPVDPRDPVTLQAHFELVLLPRGSLLADDQPVAALRDTVTGDLFVPRLSSIHPDGVAFFIPEHAHLMKK